MTADVGALLDAIGGHRERVTITLPGVPTVKARPRFSGRGTYAADRDAERDTAYRLKQVVRQPHTGNVALACIFYRPDRRRVDADNMLKHVCDAANGVLWLDDSQCTATAAVVELDAANPRTVVAVARHTSTLTRGTDRTESKAKK